MKKHIYFLALPVLALGIFLQSCRTDEKIKDEKSPHVAMFNPPVQGAPTGLMVTQTFGNSNRGEMYLQELDPAVGGATHVPYWNQSMVAYILNDPLLSSPDFASAQVNSSTVFTGLYQVEVLLSNSGQNKINLLLSTHGSTDPIDMIWRDEIYGETELGLMTTGTFIKVADSLSLVDATTLANAIP